MYVSSLKKGSCEPIAMAKLLASASPAGVRRGADAMAALGPVVYAWIQCERLLAGVADALQPSPPPLPSSSKAAATETSSSPSSTSTASTASWGGATLTPRQLFLYLDMASCDTGSTLGRREAPTRSKRVFSAG